MEEKMLLSTFPGKLLLTSEEIALASSLVAHSSVTSARILLLNGISVFS
jgi:hypothetical protein